MNQPTKFSGTLKAWTRPYEDDGLSRVMARLASGKNNDALEVLSYTNMDMTDTGWIEVGTATINVRLLKPDLMLSRQLDGLKNQLQIVRAENQQRENAILDRISKLQAIGFEGSGHDPS
jgi:hypothetical protein